MSRQRDETLSPAEHAAVLDALQDAYAECELSEEISSGVIDKLETAIEIMQGTQDERARHHSDT